MEYFCLSVSTLVSAKVLCAKDELITKHIETVNLI